MPSSFSVQIIKLDGNDVNYGVRSYSCREEGFGYLHPSCRTHESVRLRTSIYIPSSGIDIGPYIREIIGDATVAYEVKQEAVLNSSFGHKDCTVILEGSVHDVLPLWWWTTICQRLAAHATQAPQTFMDLLTTCRSGWLYASDRIEAIDAYKRKDELGTLIMRIGCGPASAYRRLLLGGE